MNSSSKATGKRVGRPFDKRPNQSLIKEDVLQTALEMTRESGLERLSIKALADRLNTSRPPLYRLFKDRNELTESVVDAVLLQLLPSKKLKSQSWQKQLMSMGLLGLDYYIKYPGVANELIKTGFPDTDVGRQLVDYLVSTLLEAGFKTKEIPSLILALSSLISGTSATICAQSDRENQLANANGAALKKHLARKGQTLPITRLGKEHFKHAMALLIAGMESSLENQS